MRIARCGQRARLLPGAGPLARALLERPRKAIPQLHVRALLLGVLAQARGVGVGRALGGQRRGVRQRHHRVPVLARVQGQLARADLAALQRR